MSRVAMNDPRFVEERERRIELYTQRGENNLPLFDGVRPPSEAQMFQHTKHLRILLEQSHRRGEDARQINNDFTPGQMSQVRERALAFLRKWPGCTIEALARFLNRKQDVTRTMVYAMSNRGLVRVVIDDDERLWAER